MTAAASALLLLAALATAAVLVRRRAPAGPAPLAVAARQPLGKDCGVAIVRWDGRDILVGYGSGAVTVVASVRRDGDAP